MDLITSCYNPTNTAQIFYNNKTNSYNILIYKNIIDYRNENMQLKLLQNINLSINLPLEINNNQFQKDKIDKKKVKIFLVGKNYLLINIIDYNILLLDYSTGGYITIFTRLLEANETIDPIDIVDLALKISQLKLEKIEIIAASLSINTQNLDKQNLTKQIIKKLNIENKDRYYKINKILETIGDENKVNQDRDEIINEEENKKETSLIKELFPKTSKRNYYLYL